MAITLRTAEDMMAEMIAITRGQTTAVTDMNVGSITRTIDEATAVQMERFYQYVLLALGDNGIVRAIMSIFEDGTPQDPIKAFGEVTVSAQFAPLADYTFPAGTIVESPDGQHVYTFSTNLLFPAGTGEITGILVISVNPGASDNVPANTITKFGTSQPIPGQNGYNFAVTNPRDFITGADPETPAQRLQRFQAFLRSLHRADAESVEMGAKTAALLDGSGYVTEQITHADCVDAGRGQAICYVCAGFNTPSLELLHLCQKLIDGYRDNFNNIVAGYKAAGVRCTVTPATLISTPVNYTLTLDDSVVITDIKDALDAAITNQFTALNIGETLRVEYMDEVVLHVPGMVDILRTSPAANLIGTDGVKYVPGAYTYTVAV